MKRQLRSIYRFTICLLGLFAYVFSQAQEKLSRQEEIFWQLNSDQSIKWDLGVEKRLPHSDNIEMSGQRVAAIIHYTVDENKRLQVERDVIFPQLRTLLKTSDPDWMKHRAYLRDSYKDNLLPVIICNGKIIDHGMLDSVIINGKLVFYESGSEGLTITRSFFPSMTQRLLVEKWIITNTTDSAKKIAIGKTGFKQEESGLAGLYKREMTTDAKNEFILQAREQYAFAISFSARLNEEKPTITFERAEEERDLFIDSIRNSLVLQTPDSVLNTLFYFSKIRAAESIYQSSMGLVHSPGGGRYYAGIWANDQAEYSGPFFPYLGYSTGNTAAMNAYRKFLQNIPKDSGKIWASFEMDGQIPCCSKDRGDAAMILFGATHFLLASGNRSNAEELWPLLKWCVAYSERMKNAAGVISSQSDELEGRFPTGTANLSTSSLYYGGLIQLSALAQSMNKPRAFVKDCQQKARKLGAAIEAYFGDDVEGLPTYKYYKENSTLRSWICLPLVVGIAARKEGTLDALFNKLWSDNGVLIESIHDSTKAKVFWDRGTLYAFRGAFKAGASDRAIEKLAAFARTRLLGFHVPYVVEAWPEGSMAHLSAESALFCRIFTEGLLGLEPAGFDRFTLQPQLPGAWQQIQLKHVRAYGGNFSVEVKREAGALRVIVEDAQGLILSRLVKEGERVTVTVR